MANRYLRSTDGSNSDDGSTWALAKSTAAGVDAIDAAGDTIYVSQSHDETTASALSIAFAGTLASPTRLICGNDGAEPPTTPADTAKISTTGASSITITTLGLIDEGMNYSCGSSTSQASFFYGPDGGALYKKGGSIVLNNSSASSRMYIGTGSGNIETKITLDNVGLKFGATGQYIQVANVQLEILGGSLLSGTSSPSFLFSPAGAINAIATGWDLSNLATSSALFNTGIAAVGKFIFRGLKLPASWTGGIFASSGAPGDAGLRVELHDYMVGTNKYQLLTGDYMGAVSSETTLVKTGGASDGTTSYSWKMVTTANAKYPLLPLETPEIPPKWNIATGSSKTVTIDILHDSATALNDDEVWVDVWYRGTSGSLVPTLISDKKSSVLATAAAQDSSSETWTTTGMSNPNKQKLSVTFTPQEPGFIQARVSLAKASKTIYVDPKITVS